MDADWSQLLPELLEMIAKKLTIYIDYVRFRAVCVKWRSILSPTPHHLPCQLPWLMLRPGPQSGSRRGFFSISENKLRRLYLPEPHGSHCCGSSQGWLVIVEQGPTILLLNPLTCIQFQLPSLTTFPNVLDFNIRKVGKEFLLQDSSDGHRYTHNLDEMRYVFIKKVVLSSSPASPSSNYIAVAILNEIGELAFCKKGDEKWMLIKDAGFYHEDVIYYKGLFYAVNYKGSLTICDVSGISPLVTVIEPLLPISHHADRLYLVDSFGELLLVTRYLELIHDPDLEFVVVYKTYGFDVFRLDSSIQEWVEVKSLGDRMLFLGTNSSLCLLATDFSGCEANCIYFTNDYHEVNDDAVHDHDSGVFNVGDGSMKALPYCTGDYNLLFLPPPIWVSPNPC
ncbi:F-box domain [Macleaya cordata]|uniref:F-box domain n=1 Tax=Macleaya cordata TaxID=56857 RepID=A0A200QEL3_MACCD|nr:F-box domain [Macleaya cordata]